MTTSSMYIKRITTDELPTAERKRNTVVGMATTDRMILEFLKSHPQFDWTPVEIGRGIEVTRVRTIINSLVRLLDEEKVVLVRRISGKQWSYQLPEWIDEKRGMP